MSSHSDPKATAAVRVTPLGGSANFRHMGGYAAAGGRRTRSSHLFRTGWLQPTDAEAARFAGYGIGRVFDFRNALERARQPLILPGIGEGGMTGLPIEQGSMAGYLQKLPLGLSTADDTRQAMVAMYRDMMRDGAAQFASLLQGAAGADAPLMIACTLGKDRTGVGSALLLHVLGVGADDIMNDYLLSAEVYEPELEQLYQRMQFASRGLTFDAVRDILTVRPEYLSGAWQEMTDSHGAVDAFIRDRLGVTEEARARLREVYTA